MSDPDQRRRLNTEAKKPAAANWMATASPV
jgi:hypothetical protein